MILTDALLVLIRSIRYVLISAHTESSPRKQLLLAIESSRFVSDGHFLLHVEPRVRAAVHDRRACARRYGTNACPWMANDKGEKILIPHEARNAGKDRETA